VWADKQYFAGGTPTIGWGYSHRMGSGSSVIVRRGNLEENTNEYSLCFFRTRMSSNNPKPEILITMASSSNREAIENVKVAQRRQDGGVSWART